MASKFVREDFHLEKRACSLGRLQTIKLHKPKSRGKLLAPCALFRLDLNPKQHCIAGDNQALFPRMKNFAVKKVATCQSTSHTPHFDVGRKVSFEGRFSRTKVEILDEHSTSLGRKTKREEKWTKQENNTWASKGTVE